MMPHDSSTTSPSARQARLGFRLSLPQERLLRHAAAATHKNMTEFVLDSACRAAERVLLDQRLFLVDEDQWQQFQAALDAPPTFKPRLHDLLTTPSPWEPEPEKP